MEPPAEGEPLDLAGLRRHAAQEVAEEIGVHVESEDLELWAVTRGEHGNVGVHFLAPAAPTDVVHAQHEALMEAESARGVESELDRLAVVRCAQEAAALGLCADYLPDLVDRYAAFLGVAPQGDPRQV